MRQQLQRLIDIYTNVSNKAETFRTSLDQADWSMMWYETSIEGIRIDDVRAKYVSRHKIVSIGSGKLVEGNSVQKYFAYQTRGAETRKSQRQTFRSLYSSRCHRDAFRSLHSSRLQFGRVPFTPFIKITIRTRSVHPIHQDYNSDTIRSFYSSGL